MPAPHGDSIYSFFRHKIRDVIPERCSIFGRSGLWIILVRLGDDRFVYRRVHKLGCAFPHKDSALIVSPMFAEGVIQLTFFRIGRTGHDQHGVEGAGEPRCDASTGSTAIASFALK